jgi:transmembrane sensor
VSPTLRSAQPSIDEQAAEWMIRLHEAQAGDSLCLEFERWKQQGPEHAAAAARMQSVVGPLQALRGQPAPTKAALNAAFAGQRSARHKRVVRAWVVALCLAAPALAVQRGGYVPLWLADESTGPGDWKTVQLQDQSSLTLAGGTAVNLHFDGGTRQVELLQGEILVEVAHDSARPFVVRTAEGSLRALGTRFVVRREQGVTRLIMLQSRVLAKSADTEQTLEVGAGGQALLREHSVALASQVDPRSVDEAWRRHQLVVEGQPLGEVLDEIARHRRGYLHFDRKALAGLQVNAVLPLDDPDQALRLLADSLPIQIHQYTPWLLQVSKAAPVKK